MSQVKLAELLNVRQSTLSDYKSGRTYPSADVLVKLATNFNVSLDWLLLGKEPDPASELAGKIRLLPEDQQRLLQAQVDTWLAMAREDSRKTSG